MIGFFFTVVLSNIYPLTIRKQIHVSIDCHGIFILVCIYSWFYMHLHRLLISWEKVSGKIVSDSTAILLSFILFCLGLYILQYILFCFFNNGFVPKNGNIMEYCTCNNKTACSMWTHSYLCIYKSEIN